MQWAIEIARQEHEVKVLLFGDSVVSEWTGKVPDGHNNVGKQIATIARLGGEIGSCATTCLDARGITENMIAKDAYRSSMNEPTQWALSADKVTNI